MFVYVKNKCNDKVNSSHNIRLANMTTKDLSDLIVPLAESDS